MKSFYISLIIFLLLMCSCKSKKIATDSHIKTIANSELSAYHNKVEIDTTRLVRIDEVKQVITIKETITEKEYDEKGNLSKETETKREIVQDTDQVASQEEQRATAVEESDSINHFRDVKKKVETETQTVTKSNGLEFCKWLGIVVGLAIVGLFIYICRKFRVN